MTNEEKAKAYDKALEIIKRVYSNFKGSAKWIIDKAFPELAESEDERIRKSIVSIVDQYARMCEKEGDPCKASLIDDALTYLERQKEHPTSGSSEKPNIQWSEEDEKCIKDVIICLEYLKREDTERQYNGDRNVNPKRYEDMIAKLKSLRPQPHWKPTEEQMTALKLAYEDAFECPESCVPHLPLKDLYNDLRKL